ncbi:UDP-GlcNAc:betaGal beta-1,3-N-acetylglucosaminyltransferase 7-like [Acipenser ruthenus]|uniref:UDP-GlcNAc:betaGal beta-1,3-N-acetylglucosaminyltransferase 7-like n=1 Tax=Acipenser ruthenus TaxID=7906 RepID=UPI0015618F89|nr:UDP-GlcNAc:betaGal beta-1,3-N-acetylglucosaminyltransferase 7-like [Acipenser ruthenus]
MEYFFRRKRVLKTLLSLSLLFATLVMIHKYKLVDERAKDSMLPVRTQEALGWFQLDNNVYQSNTILKGVLSNNNSPQGLPDCSEAANLTAVSNATAWDIKLVNCTENSGLKKKDWFKRMDPRFHQFVLYRHCKYFPMLINHPEKCSGDVHLLMVVKSVIEQHDRREAVRKTWGKEQEIDGKKIRTLFLLGSPSAGKDSKNLQKLVEYEDRIYRDILQWDFMDTFFNLTLKEVNFLKWFNIYCPRVQFIFKGDDDVFVNTNNVLELLGFRKEDPKVGGLFVGDTISKAVPIRNSQSKYFIPKELYDKPYPPYVGGGGFLMASGLARKLFAVSDDTELFPIDDVFLGMCLQKAGHAPELHPGFKTFGIMKRKVSPMNNDPCFYRNLLVIHKLSPEELLNMWKIVFNEHLICSKRIILH